MAMALGATAVLPEGTSEALEQVLSLTDRVGADLVVETVGGHADTLSTAWELVKPQGKVSVLGVFPDRIPVDLLRPLQKEVWVTFPICYGVIDGRPNALERAAQNLIDNACKFAPDGPIEVTVAGGSVRVRDHGPGLEAEDVPHLFDRFYRSVAMRSKPGSGLGLAIVKSVVDAHGGTVVARNALGGGAELGFDLPAGTAD